MKRIRVYSGTTLVFDPQWFRPGNAWYWQSNNYPERKVELEVLGANGYCYREVIFLVKSRTTTYFPEPGKRISLSDRSLLGTGEYYLDKKEAEEICRVSRTWENARGSNIPIRRAISIRDGLMSY